jgi:hypothetical protein
VLENLEKVEHRIRWYKELQAKVLEIDVARDIDFQKRFKAFYRIRRNADWCLTYFSFLETNKLNLDITFDAILRTIYESTHRLEPSFSSKILATIRTDKPVYDSQVRRNLQARLPSVSSPFEARLSGLVAVYSMLETRMQEALAHPDYEMLAAKFDERFPEFAEFSRMKKLDLLLWQSRP